MIMAQESAFINDTGKISLNGRSRCNVWRPRVPDMSTAFKPIITDLKTKADPAALIIAHLEGWALTKL